MIIISFLTGVALGLYMVVAIKYWEMYKATQYASYVRFAVVVSVSILGPGCIYFLRVLYGAGQDGDPPVITSAIFGITALTIFFAYLIYHSKKLAHGKKT